MSGIRVSSETYGVWGKCAVASNGVIEVAATLELGPRIIRFGPVGGRNMFREDVERSIGAGGEPFGVFGGGEWKIYGGHRLWTSPEAMPRTYYPDNGPVSWKETESGFVLSPPAETWTQIRKEVEVSLEPGCARVRVVHRVVNIGAWPIEFAVWALSVMDKGGVAYVPIGARDTGLLPNRVLALWPYSRPDDPRVRWGRRLVALRQGPGETPFKFGVSNEEGWAAYALDGLLFRKRYRHVVGGRYPDFGVSFESYVCDEFLELETLGELLAVEPGQAAVHEEVWELCSGFRPEEADGMNEDELYARLSSLPPLAGT